MKIKHVVTDRTPKIKAVVGAFDMGIFLENDNGEILYFDNNYTYMRLVPYKSLKDVLNEDDKRVAIYEGDQIILEF